MKVIDFKDVKCRHCYKCVRYCRVKAIAIQNEQATILTDHCIHCGKCLEVCPQNAKTFSSDLVRVKGYLKREENVVISLAPSYLGVLEFDRPGQVVSALLQLGFREVRETAEGAVLVTNEYQKLLEEGKMSTMITTCCPSVNDLVEKYYPECVSFMTPVVSPMIAHGKYIKQLYGKDTKVVFLGPCIAKKQEAEGDVRVAGAVDAILTFEEFAMWLEEEGIDIHKCEEKDVGNPNPAVNRMYPIRGGILQSVLAKNTPKLWEDMEKEPAYQMVYVDGVDNCMEMLEAVKNGELTHCFIEANVCEGGCIKGPASARWNTSHIKAKVKIDREAGREAPKSCPWLNSSLLKKEFGGTPVKDDEPSEEEICRILKSTGKYTPADELNCGACGYSTCREKAVAVYQGKAELSMCMPHALMRAESMSNVVMDVTPNLIFIIDGDLRIRECNKKAQEFLGVGKEEALQRYIFEFIEADDIEEVLRTKQAVLHKKHPVEHGRVILEETIVYIENIDSVLVTYQDVTKEEWMKEQHLKLKIETLEMAQKVIDKQMTVAQEIAGLLGETTAETKVTLTKLRDSILDEEV